MVNLETYVHDNLVNRADALAADLSALRSASRKLVKVDYNNANYRVELTSLWASDGEKSVTHLHTGSINQAIADAEKEFKRINNRSDVQADYRVELLVGKATVVIPRVYWKK